MPAQHSILELRTGRNSEHTPETAAQLFSTLPDLQNNIFYHLLKKSEHLSFELIVHNQTVYFLCHCPDRLLEYIKASLLASYPSALITNIKADPFDRFFPSPTDHNSSYYHERYLELGKMVLTRPEFHPLKTYKDFDQVDPLTTLLSVLSKTQPLDIISIQYIVSNSGEAWKNKAWRYLDNSRQSSDGSTPHPSLGQSSSLIETKLKSQGLKTSIKIAASTKNQQHSRLLTETIGTALHSISQSQGNQLKLKRVTLFKEHYLKTMKDRSFCRGSSQHLCVNELATIFHLPNKGLATIPNIAWGKTLAGEPPEDLPVIDSDTPDETKADINVYGETTFKNSKVKYGLQRKDRRRHMYVIGKTGTGKSTLLANMVINDLKNNEGLAVIDPHGDLIEIILDYIPSHRINDTIYFNPSDSGGRMVQLNLFEGENVVHRELIASGIISIFHKLYGYSWGPRLEYILRNALLTLLNVPNAKLSDVIRILTDDSFRKKIVENLDDPILKSYWVDEYNQLHQRLRNDSISSILNKIGQFVSSPLVRNVVNATTSSFSIEKAMAEGKIILANLSQGKLGEDNATLLGAMLITKIQLAAMGRVHVEEKERRDFFLYVDEFQNFATDSFVKILSEARKYRLNLTLANQYISQIPEEVQKAIFGNCGNIASFVMGADDAQAFEREYGGIYTREDLVSLGRYQILNKMSIDNIISRPFPAHTLPLLKNKNQNRDKVIRVSRERYARQK